MRDALLVTRIGSLVSLLALVAACGEDGGGGGRPGGGAADTGGTDAEAPGDVEGADSGAPDAGTEDTSADGTPSDASGSDAPDAALPPDEAEPPKAIAGAVDGAATRIGAEHVPRRFDVPFSPPMHPHMAPNPWSSIHNDPWMSDVYSGPGPVGRNPEVRSNTFVADCATVTFDSSGRIVTVCVGLRTVTLRVLDPQTLGVIAELALPNRARGGGTFTDFGGGGYFYLDNQDRAVVPTTTREIWIIGQRRAEGKTTLEIERKFDLRETLGDDTIQSALPDWAGRIWFVGLKTGRIGFIEPEGGAIRTVESGAEIANSFAVDADGAVYVVTAKELMRLDVVDGAPTITWRQVYDNDGVIKPGQVTAGSGTTPTLLDGGLIAITDNADPIQVVVMRRDPGASERVVCEVPVFERGRSATENSLIGAGRTLIVENNHGYTGPTASGPGPVTEPGVARVDVREDQSGCDVVWTAPVMAPTSVPKMSLETGLVYVVSRPTPEAHDWAFTAIDVHSGAVAWTIPTGEGTFLNNNYAGIALGPDGSMYVGVLGGIVGLFDR